MARCRSLLIACTTAVVCCPSSSHAQVKDAFVENLATLVGLAQGQYGDEGRSLVASIDTLAAALAQWDRGIAGVESGLAAEISGAPPELAARMRATLGAAYLERGRVDEALAQFDIAVRLDPGFADAHVLRGLAFELRNRPDQAAAAFHSAWQADSQSPTYAYLFLRSAPSGSDALAVSAATAVLSSVLGEGTAAGRPLVRFATAGLVDESTVSMPVFPGAPYADAFALVARARYDEAVTQLRTAADADPLVTDPALQSDEMTRAAALLKQEDVKAAVVELTAASEHNPASSEVHRILGMALFADHQYVKSTTELRLAVRLNPRDERSRLALADVLADSGDLSGAIDAMRETLRSLPKSAGAHWKLGRLYERVGNEAEALPSFESAAALPAFAGSGHLFAAIGRLYHNRLDLDAAAAAYARRVAARPNDSEAHYDLAEVYRARDTLDGALAEFLVAALLDPASARAFVMIAQMRTASGADDGALRMLRKAVELDPSHLEARYALSRTLLRLGRAEEARRELQVFEQLQSKAMEQTRRRFQENQIKIDEALEAGDRKDGRR